MEEELKEIKKSLAHIESLLQRMPEMIAAAFLLVKEKAVADAGFTREIFGGCGIAFG